MICPRCRTENTPRAKFCQECAEPLLARCGQCGAPLPPSAKFCSECAHPVGAPVAAAPRYAAPESYTPRHLAEKILTSKSGLEGERKQVTVLFADLKGSMELLADRDPEEARKILDPVLQHLMEAVHRYEGTVNQVMGDGIMALFGAPLAHEDHAVRACCAALRMQESVKRYADDARREHGVTIRIRVGLNSGEVVVRAIGSDLRMDYSAVGQTTHLAARMEQLAEPGSTLLTPQTLSLAEGFVRVTSLGPVAVKGLPAPIEVHELVGVNPVRSRLQATAARGLARFVGREVEIAQLHRALELARRGRGQLVAVVGEAGVGKSRLALEASHALRSEGWLVLEAGSTSYGKTTSYLPVIDLLKAYFRIGDGDPPRDVREKVTGKLLALDRALEASLPALLSLLTVADDDPQWVALDPPQRRLRMLEAVKRLLLREARVQPLLVVLEDLHWIDAETQELLESLVESLPSGRLLLLVNYRPEYEHRWSGKTFYTQIRLDPLPQESARDLLDGLLGDDATVEPLETLLIERTGGNPFFMEECVRTLVETGALVGERGAYRLGRPLGEVQMPATVQAILAARIDRLAPDDKRLLQSASVIGKDVPFALLATIADLSEDALGGALARLQAAELLHEARFFPDLEHTFKHALTHEVAYGSLLMGRRRELHGRTVEAIERVYARLLPEHVERLVEHAMRGGAWEKAVTYGILASTRAADRSAPPETAKAFLDGALAAIERLPERRETIEQAIEVRCRLSSVLFALDEREVYLQRMDEALALAERLDDHARLARVHAIRTNALWFVGDNTAARESGQRAVTLADALGDREIQIWAILNFALVCRSAGEPRRAAELFARAVELLRGGLERERLGRTLYPAVLARNELATSYGELGQFDEALRTHEEALRVADSFEHTSTRLTARLELCDTLVRRASYRDAVPRIEALVQALRDAGLLAWTVTASALLGYAYAMTGRIDEGSALLRGALDHAARGRRTHEARWTVYLGEALLRAGQVGQAREVAERALGLCRERGERGTEIHVRYVLGEVCARSSGAEEREVAERHYGAALELAEETGMLPYVARCRLGLARLYRLTGRAQLAQESQAAALTLLREMNVPEWAEDAEA